MEPLFFLEDIYVTGLCAQRCSPKIQRISSGAFKFLHAKNDRKGSLNKSGFVFNPGFDAVIHESSKEDMEHWQRDLDEYRITKHLPSKGLDLSEDSTAHSGAVRRSPLDILIVVLAAAKQVSLRFFHANLVS